MMRWFVLAVTLVTLGCGESPTAPSLQSSPSSSFSSDDGGHVIRPMDLRYSCPNGDVLPLSVNTHQGVAVLTWPAKNVDYYHLPIYRQNETIPKIGAGDNQWELQEMKVDPGDSISRGLLETSWGGGEGRYRARVATLNRCGQLGVWGPWVEWVFEDGDAPPRRSNPPVVFTAACRYCHP